jgi:hypothetical protein
MWNSYSASFGYFEACRLATTSSTAFSVFKSNPWFNKSVGTSSPAHLAAVLGKIWNAPSASISGSFSNFGLSASVASGAFSAAFSSFKSNDLIGTPPYVLATRYGNIGSDTGRFIETVYNLSSSFGDLSGKKIVEFGSNYGGLAFCVHQWWPTISSYYMMDFPTVQSMSMVYLSAVSGGIDTSSISYDDPSGSAYDIYISEYCLSEQDTSSLYKHYYDYVKPAIQGFYLRANFYDQMQFAKFMRTASLDFTCSVESEPIFRIPNKIIIGKK